MKSRRALILDAHSSAGIETLQSLGRAGIHVDVASDRSGCLAFSSRHADACLKQPNAADKGAFNRWLWELDRTRGYGMITASTENSLLAVNTLPADDPLRRKALLPSPAALEVGLSKEETLNRARRLGLRVPSSRLITSMDDIGESNTFPVFLKPIRSLVATVDDIEHQTAEVVRSERARRGALGRMLMKSPVQEQAYVVGRGLGVECLYDRGRLVWFFVHERIHEVPLTGGGSSYRRSIATHPQAVYFAKRLLDDLAWHGVGMVEFKLEPDDNACLMEINPRLWGSLALAIDAGVDFPLGMWRLACGERPGPQPHYRVDYYARNIVRDIDWLKENWRADHSDPLLLTRPRVASLLEYLRPIILRESWDHFDLRDLGVTARQLQIILSDGVGGGVRRYVDRLRARNELGKRLRRVVQRVRSGKMPIGRILFVCYGNICRSPFAEKYASERISGVELASAGFHRTVGRPSPEHVILAARELGVVLDSWRSRMINTESVTAADLICIMDLQNYQLLLNDFPQARDRTVPLALFGADGQLEIKDPFDLGPEETRRVLTQMKEAIEGLANVLAAMPRPA